MVDDRSTPATMSVMTGKGTTRRTVRVPDAVWDRAQSAAQERAENLSEIIRQALIDYAEQQDSDTTE